MEVSEKLIYAFLSLTDKNTDSTRQEVLDDMDSLRNDTEACGPDVSDKLA